MIEWVEWPGEMGDGKWSGDGDGGAVMATNKQDFTISARPKSVFEFRVKRLKVGSGTGTGTWSGTTETTGTSGLGP